MTERSDLIVGLGFGEDPFAHTDADKEARLAEYFVRPPYFSDVFGNPYSPETFFLFAPRGGGKTTQRKMIEAECAERNVLCLTYADFDLLDAEAAKEATLRLHLQNVLRLAWTAVLVALDYDPEILCNLTSQSRSFVVGRARFHLGKLSTVQFNDTLQSLRSQNDKVQAFMHKHSVPLTAVAKVVNAVLKAAKGIDLSSITNLLSQSESNEFDPKLELKLLVDIAREIGFSSVYVLIDRVDESPLTWNNPEWSFNLIDPLVKSLPLLGADGIAFKFFLWDAILPYLRVEGRLDRVNYRTVEWSRLALTDLLRMRLSAFSGGTVRKLDSISATLRPYAMDEVAVMFANKSPRDLIRFCSSIVAEQEELDSGAILLSRAAIHKGIDVFSMQKCTDELFAKTAKHLTSFQRIGAHSNHVDFTIPYLASEVFKEARSGSGNRIREWKKHGFVRELGTIDTGNQNPGRKVKLFVTEDIRLARFIVLHITTSQFLKTKVKQCPKCNEYNIRDIDEKDSNGICSSCYFDWIHGVQLQKFQVEDDADDEDVELPSLPMFPDME